MYYFNFLSSTLLKDTSSGAPLKHIVELVSSKLEVVLRMLLIQDATQQLPLTFQSPNLFKMWMGLRKLANQKLKNYLNIAIALV